MVKGTRHKLGVSAGENIGVCLITIIFCALRTVKRSLQFTGLIFRELIRPLSVKMKKITFKCKGYKQ